MQQDFQRILIKIKLHKIKLTAEIEEAETTKNLLTQSKMINF
jgi:hypothetical protein